MGVATVIESGLSVHSQLLPKDTEEAEVAIPADEDLAKEPPSPSDPVTDAALSDSEPESHLSYRVGDRISFGRILGRRHDPKESSKKARKRFLQHVDYDTLTEYRMLDIEKRLEKIEAIDAPPQSPKAAPGRPDELSDISLNIKRMTFAEYVPANPTPQKDTDVDVSDRSQHKHKPRHAFADQTPYSLIDVVYVDELPAPARAPTGQETTPAEAPSVQPDRVRINSPLLLKAIERMSGHVFQQTEFAGKDYLLSQAMLRPFKVFVTYEQKIRDEVKRLERLNSSYGHDSDVGPQQATPDGRAESAQQSIDHRIISKPDNSGCGAATVDGGSGNQTASMSPPANYESKHWNSLESNRCLEELQVLRELLDGDLRPTFELRKQLREGTARSVSFQDLWHLYTLGAEVVSNSADGRRQIFRVVETNGGRPFLCNRADINMDAFKAEGPHDKDLPKFEVLAHTYESDGKVLGMRQQIFTIKRYEGSKAVTSLPCYPISYATFLNTQSNMQSNTQSPRDFFIARGKRYMELARSDRTVHKRYDGLTLFMDNDEELREEVMRDRSWHCEAWANFTLFRSIRRSLLMRPWRFLNVI